MTVAVYSAIYGDFDDFPPQACDVRLFTDATDPLPFTDPRQAAKWWKIRPDLACPDADVTVWIDGRMQVLVPDLAERCVDALGDADALFVRHPFWDCIYRETVESRRWAKYDGMPLEAQAAAYRAAGHPEHWGLMHGGFLVRRNSPCVRRLDIAWGLEMGRWRSLQDQVSLPPLLRTWHGSYRWWERSPLDVHADDLGWVHWGRHKRPDQWRA